MKLDLGKRNRPDGDRKQLREALGKFVKSAPGFNKKSYGEIQFQGYGSRSTYSAYVTVSPTANVEDLWRLLLEFWNLSPPNVIVSIAGKFQKYDNQWKKVMPDTWLITNGSAPAPATPYASSIAVTDMNSIANNGVLYSPTNMGAFPAVYNAKNISGEGRRLDAAHTHFIFVQGDAWQALEFRERLLAYISTIPIEMDADFTQFITTPIIVAMVSEDANALYHVSGECANKYPVVVSHTAKRLSGILKEADYIKDRDSNDNEEEEAWLSEVHHHVQQITTCLPEQDDRDKVHSCIKDSLLKRKDVLHYPSENYESVDLAFLHGVIFSERTSFRSEIRLALSWNRMDVIRTLVPDRETFEREKDFYPIYLVMALSLNRREFLEYLSELGVHLWTSLTVKSLWSLYYKPLFKEGFETRVSPTLKGVLNSYSENKTDLLKTIGKALGYFTKYQVVGLYTEQMYHYYDPDAIMDKDKKASTQMGNQIDDTPVVPHPERDLFLWCMLMGKNDLAVLFWKGGNSLMATAIIASAIARTQGVMLDNTLQGSDVAESLYTYSQDWANLAVQFLNNSYRANRSTTLCQLTRKIDHLGGCSVLGLSYVCKHRDFIAQPAVQTALDYIWYGTTKQDQPFYKLFITLFCPIAVPCLDLIERKNVFTGDLQQNYKSVYIDVETLEEQAAPDEGIGGVLTAIEGWSGGGGGNVPRRKSCMGRAVGGFRDIYDYFNSPRIKFLVHTMVLTVNIALLSFYLLAQDSYSLFDRKNPLLMALSIMICCYFTGIAVDEVRQFLTIDSSTVHGKFKVWLQSPWNQMDFALVICYFTGQIIMWTGSYKDNTWYIGKVLLCIALFSMFIRCFQIYLVFQYFGPKVYMMRKMLKDLAIFLSIMGIIFLCYGIIFASLEVTSLANSKAPMSITSLNSCVFGIYNHIIRAPYWQLYGNALGTTIDRQSDYPGLLLSLLTAFYMLFSNILMLNLLIAMFSYTFQTIQDRASIFWCYHRFDVVEEFYDRPWLPSPFVIFEDIARFINICRHGQQQYSAFRRPVRPETEEVLNTFEQDVLEDMDLTSFERNKENHLLKQIVETQQHLKNMLQHLQERDRMQKKKAKKIS